MKFKEGDFVLVKDGAVVDEDIGEIANGWGGKILEISKDSEDDSYLIKLDAPTLNGLSDEVVVEAVENEYNHFFYYINKEDLIPHPRRDDDEAYESALARYTERYNAIAADMEWEEDEDEIDEDEIDEDEIDDLHIEWMEGFEQSSYFKQLSTYQQEHADMMVDQLFHYTIGMHPAEWDEFTLAEVLLYHIPTKTLVEQQYFEQIGRVLKVFFTYLDDNQLLESAKTFKSLVTKVERDIPRVAADPKNWRPVKQLIMNAMQAGVDIEDIDALNNYMHSYNQSILTTQTKQIAGSSNTGGLDPYRHIGRNEKVKVLYKDGTEVENKFKKIERDLRSGLCELVKG